MANSFSEPKSIVCPQCSNAFEAETWLIVDSTERPDLLEQIKNRTLYFLSCPRCGSRWEQDSSLLVFRSDKTPHIFYVPAPQLTPREFERDASELVNHLKVGLGTEWQDDWEEGIQTTSYRFISAELSDDKVATLQEQAQAEIENLQQENPEVFQEVVKIFQVANQDLTLLQQMQVFIQADTWDEIRKTLEQNPRLLSEEGQSFLNGMLQVAQLQHDNIGVNFLNSKLIILRVCRKAGVELGIELLTQTREIARRVEEIPSHEHNELTKTILTFVDAKIWEKYVYLLNHPELLSDLVDDMLFLFIAKTLDDDDESLHVAFAGNRTLLRNCREKGIENGFSQTVFSPEKFGMPDLGLPLRYKLELMHLSEGMPLENADMLSQSLAHSVALLNKPSSRISADFEEIDPQSLSFIQIFWKHILENPDLAKAGLDFQSYVWRMVGSLHDNLYQFSSELSDLDRSITFYRKAIESDALEPEDLFFVHVSLSNALDRRYEHLGLPDDLEASIQSIRQAMEVAQKHNLEEMAIALSIFGDSLRKLFWQTNQIQHLQNAVQVLKDAIERLSPDSTYSSIYYEALGNLSNIYGDLFEVTGQFEYLNEAIRTIQIVVNDAPHSPSLNNHGNLLMDRYDYAGKVDDLDRAINAYEKAIGNISPNHHMTPAIYGNLGRAFLARYQRNGQTEDIQKAITLSRRAIKLLPQDAPGLAGIMQGLSSCLLHRFLNMKKKRRAIIDESIRFAGRAIELTKPESTDYSRYLTNLGNSLRARYDYIHDSGDLKAAVDAYRNGCEVGCNVLPLATWASAENWGKWAFQRKDWAETIEALSYARQIAANLIRNQTLREDKANWLGQIGNLYILFAYAYIQSGDTVSAIEVIEEGRAQLMREALERQRKDFRRLPELGFKELHDRFENAVLEERELHNLSSEHRKQDWLLQIKSIRLEIEAAAQAIREEVGVQYFEYRFFLRPLPFDEIQKQAQDAPLVYLFATPLGGMALVVRSQGVPQIIEFPQLTDDALWNHVVGKTGTPSYFHAFFPWHAQPNHPILLENWKVILDETLAWLWQSVMGPLASALTGEINLTLIPSGLLELLPLQTAWHTNTNTQSDRQYFLDKFIVAYAPSAQALYYARLNVNRPVESLLAVEDPAGELAYSQDTVKFTQSLFQSSRVLKGKSAQRATIIKEAGKYNVLYFFTHGMANFEQPLESGLLLANEELLTLKDMFEIHADRTRLAVLSACESGLPADLKKLDEVVSLPSGLIQAGIPGVLGSYWPVLEVSTAILMTIFFDQWRKHNLPAPAALREAQIILREASRNPVAQEYFREALAEYATSPVPGADILYKQMHMSDFEHPFFWAAFAYHGI